MGSQHSVNERRAFESSGPLALEASALTIMWSNASTPTVQRVGRTAVVPVQGPLASKPNGFFLSYPELVSMVAEASASDASRIVFHLDSPGGDLMGLFEACGEIKALVAKSGKQVLSFVEGSACSAAYAIALIAPEIRITGVSCVGSVGVIQGFASKARATREAGIDVVIAASGKEKTYGHPDVDVQPEAVQSLQSVVDQRAQCFFEFCEGLRPDKPASFWRGLEAGTLIGAKAVEAGLASSISTYAQTVGSTMDKNEVKEALQALAEEGDEEAKRALAAMEGEPSDEEEEAPASEAPEEEKPAAEDPAPEEDDEEDKGPSASSALDVAAEIVDLKRQLKAMQTRDERAALMAKRPDLTADKNVKALLSEMSLKDLRKAVERLPKNPLPNPAAAAVVPITPAKGQGEPAPYNPRQGELDIDGLMGLRASKAEVRRIDGKTLYERLTPAQAREAVAARKAK